MLEKYRDSLPIIEQKNPFLDVTKVSIVDLDNYINHKLWIREKNDDGVTEWIDTLISIDKKQNIIYFKENKEISYYNIVGIEDLNTNYNESNIDFKSFIGKKVRITNKNNNSIDCVIQYIEDELIYFAVRLVDYESLSYDLSYPINLIKEIVTERVTILQEYSRAFGEYINKEYVDKRGLLDKRLKDNKKNVSYSKIDGCIFAHIIKNKLDELLEKYDGYYTSVNNSYIKGCFTEWDLLICKDKSKYNIYNPEDVVCAIELKAGGLARYNENPEIENYFKKIDEALKQSSDKIKFLYISLNDSLEKTKQIKKVIYNNYKEKFSYYFVTTGSWHYNKWNKDNLLPANIDNDKELDEILDKIINNKSS